LLVRFLACELVDLKDILHIPDSIENTNRYQLPGLEVLALLCARFRTGHDLYWLTARYRRSRSWITTAINTLVFQLDERWKHLLDFDHKHLLHPDRLAEAAKAIYCAGAPLKTVCMFVDVKAMNICRPSWHQRQCYSGHSCTHCLKFEASTLPNGLVGHLFGPLEGRRNDNKLLEEGGLLEKMRQYAIQPGSSPDDPVEDRYFQLYGDAAYMFNAHMMRPYDSVFDDEPDKRAWNVLMSRCRMAVEHSFGIISQNWPFLDHTKQLCLFLSPVGRYYRVGVLLTNAMSCMRPNQISKFFQLRPPTARQYFHD
jgi:hypothetical protein